ncbi:transferase CAF17, mitochondrial [Caerostris extrusa]|uniref:Transferase CAF17, mitochondrial n=1 Tax=Caerostris extrusa TaxID=172846 RepID=A0AAV4SRN2_CAEEX|nr:transferase CAF17, mitochondrial [Caerostris extrusa]
METVNSSLYSLLLNPKGRVLYDLILYKVSNEEYLVDYDVSGQSYLHKHLLMYRLRKDVNIEPLTNMSVWVIYKQFEKGICEKTSDIQFVKKYLNEADNIVKYTEDPRIKNLGIRIITMKDANVHQSLEQSGLNFESGKDSYQLLRYKLGVGEGVMDHTPGECLPFETNVDLLNGVGRLRSHLGQYGLGLLKYEDCAKSEFLQLQGFDIKLKAMVPKWWPSNLRSDKK